MFLINQARVPIIKLVLNGIQFDILFAAVDDPKKLPTIMRKMSQGGAGQLEELRKLSETTQSSL